MTIKKLNAKGFSHEVLLLFFVVVFAVAGVAYLVASHAAQVEPLKTGTVIDLAEPQCNAVHAHKIGNHNFGIIGVNNTAGIFSNNPCLHAERQLFPASTSAHALYLVPNWPSAYCSSHGWSSPSTCGFQAAEAAVNYAFSQSSWSPNWWLDVECSSSSCPQWASVTNGHYTAAANVSMLKAIRQDLIRRGAKSVGFYASTYYWNRITGGWRADSPAWYASGGWSGLANAPFASGDCHLRSFTAYPIRWVQYRHADNGVTLDVDVICP